MSTHIMSRLQRIFSSLPKDSRISFKEIMRQFEPYEKLLVEIALTDMIDRGLIEVDFPKGSTEITTAEFTKISLGKISFEPPVRQVEVFYEPVITAPETIQPPLSSFLSTAACLKRLINNCNREIRGLIPFIDSTFIEVLSDEFRELARRNARLSIITRKAGREPENLRALLRLYEIFSTNTSISDPLKVYEYWKPMRWGPPDKVWYFVGLHGKALIQDSKTAYIGSANWTEESISRNLEIGILTNDRALISALNRIFSLLESEAREINLSELYKEVTSLS